MSLVLRELCSAVAMGLTLLAFGPTFRQVYHFPYSESFQFYAIFTLRNLIAIAALEHYSLTTILFPAAISAGCVLLLFVLVVRRRQLRILSAVS